MLIAYLKKLVFSFAIFAHISFIDFVGGSQRFENIAPGKQQI
jgi:hypothetical protein